jgi:hypothetical protein
MLFKWLRSSTDGADDDGVDDDDTNKGDSIRHTLNVNNESNYSLWKALRGRTFESPMEHLFEYYYGTIKQARHIINCDVDRWLKCLFQKKAHSNPNSHTI